MFFIWLEGRFKARSWFGGQWNFANKPIWSFCQDSLVMIDVWWVVRAKSHSVLQFLWRHPFFYKLLHAALENVFLGCTKPISSRLHREASIFRNSPRKNPLGATSVDPKEMTAKAQKHPVNQHICGKSHHECRCIFLVEKGWDFQPAIIDYQSRMK